MIIYAIYFPIVLLQSILTNVIKLAVTISLCYGLCHRFGIVQRILQRRIELELSKISNGAQITITSIEFNLSPFQTKSFFSASTLSITDLIIHTPLRKEWHWDSPLIARIGKLDVSFNLFSVFELPSMIQFSLWNHILSTTPAGISSKDYNNNNKDNANMNFPMYMKSSIKDIYTVQAYDVQVFIEKRGNVFNFHLLDPRLEIPNANVVLESIGYHSNHTSSGLGDNHSVNIDNQHGSINSEDQLQTQTQQQYNSNVSRDINEDNKQLMTVSSSPSNQDDETNDVDLAETKANEIVKSIVNVVSTLGNAVNEGGHSGLSVALKTHKDGFVTQLKKVQDLVGVNNNKNDIVGDANSSAGIGGRNDVSNRGSRTTVIAKEGIQVIKKVGKVMEKNVLTMAEKVILLSKPPPIKDSFKAPENPDLFRFGFIEIRDLRIFTKEIISRGNGNVQMTSSTDQDDGVKGSSTVNEVEFENTTKHESDHSQTPKQAISNNLNLGVNNWSKPILLKELRLYHSDLCPSSFTISAMLKEKYGTTKYAALQFPIDQATFVGLPIEQVSNIIMTRILTETAKTKPGQLLTKAFSEVFAWFDVEA